MSITPYVEMHFSFFVFAFRSFADPPASIFFLPRDSETLVSPPRGGQPQPLNFFLSGCVYHHCQPVFFFQLSPQGMADLKNMLKSTISGAHFLDGQSMDKLVSAYACLVKNYVSRMDCDEAVEVANLAASQQPLGVKILEVMVEEMPRFEGSGVMRGQGRKNVRAFLLQGLPSFLAAFRSNLSTGSRVIALKGLLTM